MAALHEVTSGERWPRTQEKIYRFAAGHGTPPLFDDVDVTDELAKKMPLYADNFTNWANASIGMLEYAEWLELMELGFGASLHTTTRSSTRMCDRRSICPIPSD
ncbi:MAG: hypothetical protein J6S33_01165 [Aeriscardovia sp.]|nr:hypothetical protein [Aeriscardovia sp.]